MKLLEEKFIAEMLWDNDLGKDLFIYLFLDMAPKSTSNRSKERKEK
jgi:hypothetical protein